MLEFQGGPALFYSGNALMYAGGAAYIATIAAITKVRASAGAVAAATPRVKIFVGAFVAAGGFGAAIYHWNSQAFAGRAGWGPCWR